MRMFCWENRTFRFNVVMRERKTEKFQTINLQINLFWWKTKRKFQEHIPSPKKVVRNTKRNRNLVTHLTSSEHTKNAKKSHGEKQKPTRKVPEKEIRSHMRVRLILILIEWGVIQKMTPCMGPVELHTGLHCRLWKATGYSVNSAKYGTTKNVLEQPVEDVYLWKI
jgi:hypothetical protein